MIRLFRKPPNLMPNVLITKRRSFETEESSRKKGRQSGLGVRDWSNAVTGWPVLELPETGRDKELNLLDSHQEKSVPADTLMSDILPPKL